MQRLLKMFSSMAAGLFLAACATLFAASNDAGTVKAAATPASGSAAKPHVLQKVSDIRALTTSQASGRLPVKLHCVVTFADKVWQHFFVQDETGGIYVRGWVDGIQAGQCLDLTAVTDPGKSVRMLIKPSAVFLGAINLPVTAPVRFKDLMQPAFGSTWVEIDGVIRSVSTVSSRWVLRVATESGLFEAVVPGAGEAESRRWMVNTVVRVRGVCTETFDSKGRTESFALRIPNMQFVQILDLAPTNAFAVPIRPIKDIHHNPTSLTGLRRTRVQGEVTLKESESSFILQDPSGAVRVVSHQTNAVTLGRHLELVGFPSMDGFRGGLDESIFRYCSNNWTVTPRELNVQDVSELVEHDRELVVVEGRLLNGAGSDTLTTLLLQNGSMTFQARFGSLTREMIIPFWSEGCLLRLTGVCETVMGADHKPRTFVLLMRNHDDVQVLHQPPAISSRLLWSVVGGLLFTLMVIVAWVALLRKQVRQRTEELSEASTILQSAMDCSRAGIVIPDAPDGKLRYHNKMALVFGGVFPDQSSLQETKPDRFILDRFHNHDGTSMKEGDFPLVRALQSGESSSKEYMVLAIDGTTRFVLASAAPVTDANGKLKSAIMVLIDVTERQKAQAEIKKLQGILPICSSCKKVRDDQGYWQQVEVYIRDHSEAQCSHGICDDCMKILYPDTDQDALQE